MVKFIFVRHGESKSNEGGKFAGSLNVPLSELGQKQAKAVCKYVLETYKIDAIYSSPLSRAFDTVKGVGEALGLTVTPHDGLKEVHGGLWEGRSIEEIKEKYGKDYALWQTDIGNAQATGGENFTNVQKRALKTLDEIAKKEDGKTVLIGTHAGVIRCLQCRFQGLPVTAMKHIPWVANTALTEADYDGENFYLLKYAFDGHLKELKDEIKTKIPF